MTGAGVLYHMARADFLERVRRRSFLFVLGAAVWLGYAVAAGIVEVRLDRWRGVFNSAWAGAAMAIVATTLVSLAAFYVVKNAVDRDRRTGVGQILATTPMTKVAYTVGKWLSNLAVLGAIVAVLSVAALALQLVAGESREIHPMAILAPMLLVALPAMAVVAAVAVLFEMIPGLRGGFGNVVYFFLWTFLVVASIESGGTSPFDVSVMTADMQAQLHRIDPDYKNGLLIGGGADERGPAETFEWDGLDWTPRIVAGRLAWFLAAFGIAAAAALPFDRFDPARRRLWRSKKAREAAEREEAPLRAPSDAHLGPLAPGAAGFGFVGVVAAELRLMLKGRRWWWYAGAAGIVVAGLANDPAAGRAAVLPLAWMWPLLLWSAMGAREARFGTSEMLFSAPRPIARQLPASWCAGALVALLAASGVVVRLLAAGDVAGLGAVLAGAAFVPAFALAAGAWTGGSTLFEALYVVLWYAGPLNHVPTLDFMGASDATVAAGMPLVFAALAALLVAVAAAGRSRQLRA